MSKIVLEPTFFPLLVMRIFTLRVSDTFSSFNRLNNLKSAHHITHHIST